MDLPPLLSPTVPRLQPNRTHQRNASRSPTRERFTDDILADLSPATTLEAFTNPSGKLKASIEAATASERAFGIRATLASKKIQEWLNELLSWPWPKDGGSEGFEIPANSSRRKLQDEYSGKTRVNNRHDRHGSREPEEEEYMGSLLAGVVDGYHVRIEEITEDMEDLDVEAIKRKVLETHGSSKSRPSSSSSSNSIPRTFPSYTKMDDFTAIITATVIYALPNLSKLLRLMDIWRIRLLVLHRVPPLLLALEEVEAALRSGWDVLGKSVYDYGQEPGPGEFLLSRNTFRTMQNVLQDKVTQLGRDIDFMLDTLEGREDTLPEAWLDRMEAVENDYGEWVVACDQMISKGEWENMSRVKKAARDAKKAEDARLEMEEVLKAKAIEAERLKIQGEAASLKRSPQPLVEEENVGSEEFTSTIPLNRSVHEDVVIGAASQNEKRTYSIEEPLVPSTLGSHKPYMDLQDQNPSEEVSPEVDNTKNAEQIHDRTVIGLDHGTLASEDRLISNEAARGTDLVHVNESEEIVPRISSIPIMTVHPEPTLETSEVEDIGITSLEVPAVLSIETSSKTNEVDMMSRSGTLPMGDQPYELAPSSPLQTQNTDSTPPTSLQPDFGLDASRNPSTNDCPAALNGSEPVLSVEDNEATLGDVARDYMEFGHDSESGDTSASSVSLPSNLLELEGELDGMIAVDEHLNIERFEPAYEDRIPTDTVDLATKPTLEMAGHWAVPDLARANNTRTPSSGSARSQASAPSGRTSKRHSRNISVAIDSSFSIDGVRDEINLQRSPTTSPAESIENHVGDNLSLHDDLDPLQTAGVPAVMEPVIDSGEDHITVKKELPGIVPVLNDESRGDTIGSDIKDSTIAQTNILVGKNEGELQSTLDVTLEHRSSNLLLENTRATGIPSISIATISEVPRRGSTLSNASTVVTHWGDGSTSPTATFRDAGSLSVMEDQSPSVAPAESPTLHSPESIPLRFPPSTVTVPRHESLDSPTSPTFSLSDASTTSADAPVFGDLDVVAAPLSSPKKRIEDQLQEQISSLLESIPAQIHLTSGPNDNGSSTLRPKKTRKSVTPAFRPQSSLSNRSQTPSFLLAPAYSKTVPRPKSQYAHPEIKVYHLSRSTGEAPIKLFVRLVGENGERVMVRVGGGWADLGEYLKEYASHHGRRSTAEDKIEIQDLSPRVVSSSSTASTATVTRDGDGRYNPVPTIRPSSAFDRPFSSLDVRKSRKSLGDNTIQAGREYRSPSTPLAPVSRRSLGEQFATSSTGPNRSSSRLSWTDDDVSLGLAGPKGKKTPINEKDQEWVETMKEKVRQASAEKNREKEMERRSKERGASFGEMDKVGSTKRLFRKA
jgi:hypothetical protein